MSQCEYKYVLCYTAICPILEIIMNDMTDGLTVEFGGFSKKVIRSQGKVTMNMNRYCGKGRSMQRK